MKRLHLAFGITTLVVIIIGLIHGSVALIVAKTTFNPTMSFPLWASFVLPFMYYCVGASIILLSWLTTWIITRSVQKKALQKNQSRQ